MEGWFNPLPVHVTGAIWAGCTWKKIHIRRPEFRGSQLQHILQINFESANAVYYTYTICTYIYIYIINDIYLNRCFKSKLQHSYSNRLLFNVHDRITQWGHRNSYGLCLSCRHFASRNCLGAMARPGWRLVTSEGTLDCKKHFVYLPNIQR